MKIKLIGFTDKQEKGFYKRLEKEMTECDFCGTSDDTVGIPSCNDDECQQVKVCDRCDIDGSSYSGWCEEYERSQQ